MNPLPTLCEIETLIGKLCDTIKTTQSSDLPEGTQSAMIENILEFVLSEVIQRWPKL